MFLIFAAKRPDVLPCGDLGERPRPVAPAGTNILLTMSSLYCRHPKEFVQMVLAGPFLRALDPPAQARRRVADQTRVV